MAITQEKLNEVLSRASTLMTPEMQKHIDSLTKQQNQYDNTRTIKQTNTSNPIPKTNIKESKLPEAILKSMTQNRIDMPDIMSTSILDNLNVPTNNVNINENKNQSSVKNHQTPDIDYNYIKFIVNECIKENLDRIKQELLNEASLKTIKIGAENKIQLIDNKNNLFESKLEYKKTLNKK